MKIFQFFSRYSLVISIVILTFSFICFYPSKYISIDEHEYLNNSYRIIDNNLLQECAKEVPAQYEINEKCVSKYNLGTSFFFIPAILVNFNLVYLISFSVFLLGIIFFNKILKEKKIDPIFTFLYAFYPAFLYYSRTLFSEIFSVTLLTIIAYFLVKISKNYRLRYGFLIGILTGIAVLIRYTNIVSLIILIGGTLIVNYKHNFKKFALITLNTVLGGLPFFILFLVINQTLYGSFFASGYSLSGEEIFLLENVPNLFLKYSGVLLVVYPLLFIGVIGVKLLINIFIS